MEERANLQEQTLINQIAQSMITREAGRDWFDTLTLANQRVILRELALFALQAGARDTDAEAAIAKSGLRPGHTPAVLLRRGPAKLQIAKILGLPNEENTRSFELLLALFSIADERRRRLKCGGTCTHWWHRDLADPAAFPPEED